MVSARNEQNVVNNIRHIMQEKGLKQKFVAQKAGMTDQQLTDILNDRKLLRVEHLKPMALALGVTVERLIS